MPRVKSTFVKFHWKPKLGLQSVVWNEAVKINGADPDFHRRDLWTAIQSGRLPGMGAAACRLFDHGLRGQSFEFDVLDPTKLIPEEVLAVEAGGAAGAGPDAGQFLRRNRAGGVHDARIVPPGIDFSNDPLLQGRNFSYLDTQLKRLGGPNFTHLPINAPKCPFAHFQQDGHMAMRNPRRPRQLSAQLVGRGTAARASRRSAASRSFRRCRAARRQAPAARRELCRSLQPGAAVLHQPDARRAASHRRCADLRTEQGRRRL
jgi:catalase